MKSRLYLDVERGKAGSTRFTFFLEAFVGIGRWRSRLGDPSAWSAGPRCKNAHDERGHRGRQHESGGSNTFDVADTQMRPNRAHKVQDKPDACRHAERTPPDAKNQPQGPCKLASR